MRITEGLATIETPGNGQNKGPGRAEPGFYNASQKLNRDISILFLNWAKPKLALDGFGGTGIRGIRFSLETGTKTVITERNRVSADIIENNIKENNADVELLRQPFQSALADIFFDYIDIDPYGTALPYMDQAIESVKNGGYVALTATDLSALTGSVKSKTSLRYGAYISNDAFKHEMGIRLLAGTFARKASALEREAIPVLSVWHSHYYRIIFRIRSGTGRASHNLENIGYINKNKRLSEKYPDIAEGPVWVGNLFLDEFIKSKKIPDHLHDDPLLRKYTTLFENEDISVLYTDVAEIGRLMHGSPAKLRDVMDLLGENGFRKAGRTQFSPTGIKVKTTMDNVMELMLDH